MGSKWQTWKKGYIGDVNEAKLFENEACTGNIKSYIYQARFMGSCNNFILNRSAPGAHHKRSRVHWEEFYS